MKESILNSRCRAHEVALNPGLLGYNDGYLLATRIDSIDPMHVNVPIEGTVRRYWGSPHVQIAEANAQFQPTGRRLEFHEAEDPRLFRVDGQLWVCFCRSWRQWVMRFHFDHHFERFEEAMTPNFERNAYQTGPAERNWTWINDTEESLDCIYRWEPFTVLRFDLEGACLEKWRNNSVILPWRYGKVNGGTPSVLLPSGERFSVFHSHLGDPRTYYMGGIYHQPEWPYEPIRLLPKPIMIGSERFKRWPLMTTGQRVNAVFPCGLVAEPDRLLVSYGVNDCVCAVAEIGYDELKDYDTGA